MPTNSPITHGVPASEHPPIYRMHRYYARRPSNVFSFIIESSSKKGDVILDPFCGGGVTLIEGIKLDRKVIGVDLNPLATFVTRAELLDIDIDEFKKIFESIESKVSKEISSLYLSVCPNCKKSVPARWLRWNTLIKCPNCKEISNVENAEKVLNKSSGTMGKFICSSCKAIISGRKNKSEEVLGAVKIECDCGFNNVIKPSDIDIKCWKKSKKLFEDSETWYPKDDIPMGMETKRLLDAGIKHFYQLFTERNAYALSLLMKEIKKIKNDDLRFMMLLVFGETLRYVTKLSPSMIKGWDGHMYWIPYELYEGNIWLDFVRSFSIVLDGKTFGKDYVSKMVKEAKNTKDIFNGKNCLILTKSSNSLEEIPDKSIDVIVTDPPYGGNVNYSELSNFWLVWLKGEFGMKGIAENEEEAIINPRQEYEGGVKDSDAYQKIMTDIFKECHRVLKKGGWMIMTFHNRKFGVWKSLHLSAGDAGFILPDRYGIIYQTPIQKYIKTIHQKAGGAMLGDFLVSFKSMDEIPEKPEVIEELTESEEQILKKEAEECIRYHIGATESFIVVQLMPVLMKNGANLLHKIGGKDLRPFLEKYFVKKDEKWYLEDQLDKSSGKLKPIDFIPAEQRIETLIQSFLTKNKEATMDELLKVVFEQLINHTTPTDEEIVHVLDRICERIEKKNEKKTVWRLKVRSVSEYLPKSSKEKQKTLLGGEVVQEHSLHDEIIKDLFNIGVDQGFEPHIGETEQRKNKELKDMSYPLGIDWLPKEVLAIIREIDLIWRKRETPFVAFEVVYSIGTLVEALKRLKDLFVAAENLRMTAYILIPAEHKDKLLQTVRSPSYRKVGLEGIRCILFDDIIGKKRVDLSKISFRV